MRYLKHLALTCLVLLFTAVSSFALQVGDRAPDFQALSTTGAITLSQLQQGPVVLAFYYADFTPV